MSIRKNDTTAKTPAVREVLSDLEICSCLPLSPQHPSGMEESMEADENEQPLLAPPTLLSLLRTRMQSLLSSVSTLSILLLHVSQLEHIQFSASTGVLHRRKRFHPSDGVVEQILTNVRRAVRTSDDMYLDTGKGAAIIFPNVNGQGAYTILERVYNSVNLLQAETIVPPLSLETDIVMSIVSYPEQGQSLEAVLGSADRVTRHLTLRPAVTPHLWDTMPPGGSTLPFLDTLESQQQDGQCAQRIASAHAPTEQCAHMSNRDTTSVPYLQLPSSLSKRMKSLLSYKIATQFSCIPVGRDHNRLTLAMANPTDTDAINALRERTGMVIFPVSCDREALEALLAEHW